ncbi:DNA polymerase III delta subunit [Arcticibacter tournemirensis]|uniref:DNA polymerase III subunit delta n=1 Tax=Arcticibacter tournemirensis TaxID=699437 RepID=A0A5M9HBR2_9SPHI|nr:DNA polymerase III subunit delta [Arcticibacter tournemirensis]KAA8484396.1 DNA polymerase III subunit delta [Arcticibacter tournemirensis]TQM49838.1 DNA polymerase III delta subunit [Arcticibacter tournemirensis]
MTVAALLNDLKARKFKPVYLFHGEEPFYIDLFSDYIEKNLLTDAEKGFNQTVLYGRDTDIMTVLNSAKRFPMMSDYQLVLIKEAQDMKWGKETEDKKSIDPFLTYLEKPLASTILVFCYKHGKFDKRKKTYKAIEKNGVVFESAVIYENKVPAWVEDFVREKAYRINPRAAALIAEYLGNDLSKISNELEKLMLNIPKGNEISVDDVQNNIGISKEYNVFELQDALAKRDILKANRIINYFGSNTKANPIQMVLGALNTWFTKILKYHYIADRSPQTLAKELGVNPYFIKDYHLAAKSFNLSRTFEVISYLREYDLKTKGVDSTGNTEDGDLLKELIFKILH